MYVFAPPPVSLIPVAIATGVVDTGGKFAAGIVDTSGKFAAGINNASENGRKICLRCPQIVDLRFVKLI
jgi:hypothetical protein